MFERMVNGATKAFNRIEKVVGSTPDLDVYSKMDMDAFKELAAQFGEEAVQGYIQEMEYKRLTNGTKGT